MPESRYYVLAECGGRIVELFKLVQSSTSAVITSPLLKRLVTVENIHFTHHPPKDGRATRIVHLSDAGGTDERIPLHPAADPVELPRVVLDLSDFDWRNAKPFAKRSYAEKWVLDVEQYGPYVDARFFLGSPSAVLTATSTVTASDDWYMLSPKPGGFGTVPGGHGITYARLVFDDEAEVTLGCLLFVCHPPEGDTGPSEPWDLDVFQYVAYGGGEGEYARGRTDR
jgi:hypothetical protein